MISVDIINSPALWPGWATTQSTNVSAVPQLVVVLCKVWVSNRLWLTGHDRIAVAAD